MPRENCVQKVADALEECSLYVKQNMDPPWVKEEFISEQIGRGVFITERRPKNAFILQYCGELIDKKEALKREKSDDSVFRYFVHHRGRDICIDATEEPAPGTSSLGRLINHSRKGNVSPKVVEIDGIPRVCFFAKWQLNIGDQVLYDYGVKLPFADLISPKSGKATIKTGQKVSPPVAPNKTIDDTSNFVGTSGNEVIDMNTLLAEVIAKDCTVTLTSVDAFQHSKAEEVAAEPDIIAISSPDITVENKVSTLVAAETDVVLMEELEAEAKSSEPIGRVTNSSRASDDAVRPDNVGDSAAEPNIIAMSSPDITVENKVSTLVAAETDVVLMEELEAEAKSSEPIGRVTNSSRASDDAVCPDNVGDSAAEPNIIAMSSPDITVENKVSTLVAAETDVVLMEELEAEAKSSEPIGRVTNSSRASDDAVCPDNVGDSAAEPNIIAMSSPDITVENKVSTLVAAETDVVLMEELEAEAKSSEPIGRVTNSSRASDDAVCPDNVGDSAAEPNIIAMSSPDITVENKVSTLVAAETDVVLMEELEAEAKSSEPIGRVTNSSRASDDAVCPDNVGDSAAEPNIIAMSSPDITVENKVSTLVAAETDVVLMEELEAEAKSSEPIGRVTNSSRASDDAVRPDNVGDSAAEPNIIAMSSPDITVENKVSTLVAAETDVVLMEELEAEAKSSEPIGRVTNSSRASDDAVCPDNVGDSAAEPNIIAMSSPDITVENKVSTLVAAETDVVLMEELEAEAKSSEPIGRVTNSSRASDDAVCPDNVGDSAAEPNIIAMSSPDITVENKVSTLVAAETDVVLMEELEAEAKSSEPIGRVTNSSRASDDAVCPDNVGDSAAEPNIIAMSSPDITVENKVSTLVAAETDVVLMEELEAEAKSSEPIGRVTSSSVAVLSPTAVLVDQGNCAATPVDSCDSDGEYGACVTPSSGVEHAARSSQHSLLKAIGNGKDLPAGSASSSKRSRQVRSVGQSSRRKLHDREKKKRVRRESSSSSSSEERSNPVHISRRKLHDREKKKRVRRESSSSSSSEERSNPVHISRRKLHDREKKKRVRRESSSSSSSEERSNPVHISRRKLRDREKKKRVRRESSSSSSSEERSNPVHISRRKLRDREKKKRVRRESSSSSSSEERSNPVHISRRKLHDREKKKRVRRESSSSSSSRDRSRQVHIPKRKFSARERKWVTAEGSLSHVASKSCHEDRRKSKSHKRVLYRSRSSRKEQRNSSESSSMSRTSHFSSDVSSRKKKKKHGTRLTKVTVGIAKHRDGKRVRDKMLACFICGEKGLWLARHLRRQHEGHFLVAQVLSKSGQEQKNGFKRLKNLGSFKHNVKVLKRGRGELILVRRTNGINNPDCYLPCTECYGFYFKYDLWRHKCPCKNAAEEKCKDVVDNSRGLLDGALGVGEGNRNIDNNLKRHVLKKMRPNHNLNVVKSDWLILSFGTALLKRIGPKGHRRIGSKMRILAKLLDKLRNALEDPSKTLADFLNGSHFDAVIEAIEDLCGLHSDNHGQRTFKVPSLALAYGNILPKICQIKKGVAIRDEDDVTTREVERFMDLYKSDYSDSLSCPALSTLKTRSHVKHDELPTTEDLLKLKVFTEKQMKIHSNQLKHQPQYSSWRKLSEVVLTRLLVFNKRRASEPAKLLVSQYQSRPDWHATSNKEVVANLQPLEQKLMERMDLVQVPGKRNRRVPILITPDVTAAMKLLLEKRDACGVPAENPFFFATDSASGYLNTWLVLHTAAVEAGVTKPRLITSGRLRKYIATLAQLVDLGEGEKEWLADHLGHTMGVHKSHYRLQEPVIEMAQLSKLLIAVEAGKASQFVGKKLSDISISDVRVSDDDGDVGSGDEDAMEESEQDVETSDDEFEEEMQKLLKFPLSTSNVESNASKSGIAACSKKLAAATAQSNSDSGGATIECEAPVTAPSDSGSEVGRSPRKRSIAATVQSEDESDMETTRRKKPAAARKVVCAGRPRGIKRQWSEEELAALPCAFCKFYKSGQTPGAGAIRDAVKLFPVLSSRTLPQIKSRVFHEIQKHKKDHKK